MTNNLFYIKRKNIDTDKYDSCIAEAVNSQIYAYSWYLDCVADDWDILVLGDYEVVMPVPFLRLKRHLFVKKIYQPDFCQQLGVFSRKILSKEIFDAFYKKFYSLKPRNYNFSSFGTTNYWQNRTTLSERLNHEINLSETYESIYKGYSKNLKRNIKKAEKKSFTIRKNISKETLIRLKKENANYTTKKRQYTKMSKLIDVLLERGNGSIYGVFEEEEPIAACLVLHHKNRLITIISASNDFGKKYAAIHFLLNRIIENNANSDIVLDFEGSMIPGVARFYKSFGAKEIVYKSLLYKKQESLDNFQ